MSGEVGDDDDPFHPGSGSDDMVGDDKSKGTLLRLPCTGSMSLKTWCPAGAYNMESADCPENPSLVVTTAAALSSSPVAAPRVPCCNADKNSDTTLWCCWRSAGGEEEDEEEDESIGQGIC